MKSKAIFAIIVLIALALRLLSFESITFFYDQARDAVVSQEIWQGDPLKIIGPKSDFEGLHHGPLYWYLISPVYTLTQGNVFAVKLFLILINLLTLYFVYDLAKKLFNPKAALISIMIFSVSFEAIQYARWLSNPAPAVLTITISFWSLYNLVKGKNWAFITLLSSWALSFQFQLFLIYQILIFVLIWILLKGGKVPKIPVKYLAAGILSFFLVVSTYAVSELKFNFQGTRALADFFATRAVENNALDKLITGFPKELVNLAYLNIWGINYYFALIAFILSAIFIIYVLKKGEHKKEMILLLIWFISPAFIIFFSGPNTHYLTIGAGIPLIIITSYILSKISLKALVVLLVLIFLGNYYLIRKNNPEGEVLFAVQKQMILKDELAVIDWIYSEADGKPFYINTVTYPLFINTTWAHLFNWYGKSEYGFMPIWWGETQVDVPGSNIQFAPQSPTERHFLIIEPNASSDEYYVQAIKYLENSRSEVINKERIGYFTVEERKITRPRIFTAQDVFYTIKHTDLKILEKVE